MWFGWLGFVCCRYLGLLFGPKLHGRPHSTHATLKPCTICAPTYLSGPLLSLWRCPYPAGDSRRGCCAATGAAAAGGCYRRAVWPQAGCAAGGRWLGGSGPQESAQGQAGGSGRLCRRCGGRCGSRCVLCTSTLSAVYVPRMPPLHGRPPCDKPQGISPFAVAAAPLDDLGAAAQLRDQAVQAAALAALEALCTAGAPLLSPQQRRQMDDVAVHVAATSAAAVCQVSCDSEAAISSSLAALQLSAHRLLLATVLAPAPHRPPHLAAALRLWRVGSAGGAGGAVPAFCRHVSGLTLAWTMG